MPTYEYKCQKCGYAFEKFQSMNDKPIKKCPECGKSSVKKLISSGSGIIFKGSGFYATDYRKTTKGDSENKTCPVAKDKNPGCASCKASGE